MPRPLNGNSATTRPSCCSLRIAASILRNCSCSTAFFVLRTLRLTGKKSVSLVALVALWLLFVLLWLLLLLFAAFVGGSGVASKMAEGTSSVKSMDKTSQPTVLVGGTITDCG